MLTSIAGQHVLSCYCLVDTTKLKHRWDIFCKESDSGGSTAVTTAAAAYTDAVVWNISKQAAQIKAEDSAHTNWNDQTTFHETISWSREWNEAKRKGLDSWVLFLLLSCFDSAGLPSLPPRGKTICHLSSPTPEVIAVGGVRCHRVTVLTTQGDCRQWRESGFISVFVPSLLRHFHFRNS